MRFFEQVHERFPYRSDYVCIDIETSGLRPDQPPVQICTIGHAVVRNNRLVKTEWYALDWTTFPNIDHALFASALEKTQYAMEKQGKNFAHTWDWLAQNGTKPLEVLEYYLGLVEQAEKDGDLLIAHNGWSFDLEFLKAGWQNWLQTGWEFTDDALYDTGAIEKASQLSEADNPLPLPDETLKQWTVRVRKLRRKGIFWALDTHCMQKYRLAERAGLDVSQLHQSPVDAAILHNLYQCHKELACASS